MICLETISYCLKKMLAKGIRHSYKHQQITLFEDSKFLLRFIRVSFIFQKHIQVNEIT